MVKHTPGPWIVQKNDRLEISTLGNNCKMLAHVYRSGKAFGVTYHNPSAWANACLMALAPELLQALQELLEAKDHARTVSQPAGSDVDIYYNGLDLARAEENARDVIEKLEAFQ